MNTHFDFVTPQFIEDLMVKRFEFELPLFRGQGRVTKITCRYDRMLPIVIYLVPDKIYNNSLGDWKIIGRVGYWDSKVISKIITTSDRCDVVISCDLHCDQAFDINALITHLHTEYNEIDIIQASNEIHSVHITKFDIMIDDIYLISSYIVTPDAQIIYNCPLPQIIDSNFFPRYMIKCTSLTPSLGLGG